MSNLPRIQRLERVLGDPYLPTPEEWAAAIQRMKVRMRYYAIAILHERGTCPPAGFSWAEPTSEEASWLTPESQGRDWDTIERYEQAKGWSAVARMHECFEGNKGLRELRAMVVPPPGHAVKEPDLPSEWSPMDVVHSFALDHA